ncbi:hypothetical protein B6V00_04490 [ANME-1 cluster archaeon ex4572_4]|nr:MAG: hypothetical protein B6V00_04490 [ANME-1 cluster archaeon ex4572_4]
MKILAVDIGAGTQDIMVYDDEEGFENAYKLVLPSPTRFFAEEVRRAEQDLVIFGETIGGGPFSRAVLEHLKKYKVYATERAARTLRDDLAVVRGYGVEIISEDEVADKVVSLTEKETKKGKKGKAKPLRISEFNPELLPLLVAVAVQDHGVAPPGVSDRENRFRIIAEKVGSGAGREAGRGGGAEAEIESFAYLDAVPDNLSRMKSVFQSVKSWHKGPVLLMDTGPAAVLGSLEDERVKGVVKEKKSLICVNVGNAHTIAMSLSGSGNGSGSENGSGSGSGSRITGIFEHHTRLLARQKLSYYLKKLSDGSLTFEEVFADGGHGALTIGKGKGKTKPEIISLTGPRREKMRGLGFFSAPAGDMMMTGAVGLVKAVLKRL